MHVCVQSNAACLTYLNRSVCRCTFMPRDKGGIGRTGKKHKKKASHDIHRQPKAESGVQALAGTSCAEELLVAAQAVADATADGLAKAAATRPDGLSLAGLGLALEGVEVVEVSSGSDDQEEDAPSPRVACYNPAYIPREWPPEAEPTPSDHVVKATKRMRGSRLAEEAIHAAVLCELKQVWLREGVDAPLGVIEGWEEYDAYMRERGKEIHQSRYHELLSELKKSFPMMVCCEHFERGMCMHGIPCECGKQQAPWP